MQPPRPWTVLAHGPLEKHTDTLWTVQGELPDGGPLKRRMSLVKLADGRLLIHSAIALELAAMADIEAWGVPAFLLVPSGRHRLDAAAYKARYPHLKVVCPTACRAQVEKVVPVDGGLDLVPADPQLRIDPLVGCKSGEAVLVVRNGKQTHLVFNDAIFNVPHQPGFGGLILRLLGSSGKARVTRIFRLFEVTDAAAFGDQLQSLVYEPGLTRIIVSHGNIIDTDPAGTLRRIARQV